MSDAGIVADIARAPASQQARSYKSSKRTASLSSSLGSDSSGPAVHWTGIPRLATKLASTARNRSIGQRFRMAAGEGMDRDEILDWNLRHGDARIPSTGGGSRKESEGQMAHGLAELGPVRAVPGVMESKV